MDISEGFNKEELIEWCKACERYYIPPKQWEFLKWGSIELLGMLLRRNTNLRTVKLLNSHFVFTEEHSKRILIEVEIEKEVDGQQIRNSFQIKFIRRNKQCPDCENVEAKLYWNAIVQIRQRPHAKRTFLYLEQMILNHKMYGQTSNLKERKDGIDFYYLHKNHAKKLISFLEGIIGLKVVESSRLLSLDMKSNIAKNKNTFSVDILPLCKDDLIFISKKIAGLKNSGQYLLILKVGTKIRAIDFISAKVVEFSNQFYWQYKEEFYIVLRSNNLVKYFVAEIEKGDKVGNYSQGDVFVTRDFETQIHTKTHLSHTIDEEVLGYDIGTSQLKLCEDIKFKFIIVRKYHPISSDINIQTQADKDMEYTYFIEDIVEDKELKMGIKLYDKTNTLIENLDLLKL